MIKKNSRRCFISVLDDSFQKTIEKQIARIEELEMDRKDMNKRYISLSEDFENEIQKLKESNLLKIKEINSSFECEKQRLETSLMTYESKENELQKLIKNLHSKNQMLMQSFAQSLEKSEEQRYMLRVYSLKL